MSIDFDKARKLASTAIECMDLDGVIDYATDRLTQYYLGLTEEEFELDWADYFPSEAPSEPEEEDHFCTNCKRYTPHKCTYSNHERDSSGDYFVCQECKWTYSGLTGKYSPPYDLNDEEDNDDWG